MIEVNVLEVKKKKDLNFPNERVYYFSGWIDNSNKIIIRRISTVAIMIFYRIYFYRIYYVSSTALSIFHILTHLTYVQDWDCRIMVTLFLFF